MKQETTWTLLLLVVLAVFSAPVLGKTKAKTQDGAGIFAQHCAKCHSGGGNLVKSSKPIVGSKQLQSIITFKAYLSAPPGHMPYLQDVVGNKKVLEKLYDYCKKLQDKPQTQAYIQADRSQIEQEGLTE